MELQQRDVVIQRLAVVVVVDVGRGHPQGLRQSEVSIGISWTNQRSVFTWAPGLPYFWVRSWSPTRT